MTSVTRRRALVTGATGFVGANLARRLLAEGHDVHLLVRPRSTRWRLDEIADDVTLHEGDVTDADSIAATLGAARPDWIFHLAASGAYSWQTDERQMIDANLTGTVNLLAAALRAGFEAFVNSGSSSEYGAKDHAPSENAVLEPNSPYAVTKAAATHYCGHVARSGDVHAVTLRLYSVYGAFEDPGRLLPALTLHALEGRLPPLADPEIARDFVYVRDVEDAYLSAAAATGIERGAIFNVGTGTQTTLREVVATAKELLDVPAEPVWGSLERRPWDTEVWVSDSRRIRDQLGWRPRYAFADGLAELADWFRASAARRELYRRLEASA